MAIDIFNLAVSSTIVLISVIIFSITVSIYRRTKGGSQAFKYWAIACGCYVVERGVNLLLVLTQEQNVIASVLCEGMFKALAAFFVMLGMLFLASDLKVIGKTSLFLKKLEFVAVLSILVIFSGMVFYTFTAPVPPVSVITAAKVMGSTLEMSFWALASVSLFLLYKNLRKGSKGWALLFAGSAIVAINTAIQIFLYMGFAWLDVLDLITSVPYAILLIAGFFLIDRSMKA